MPTSPSSPARERVLGAAERLFGERGFAGVTMRDLADALGVKQASLYYHAPNGKEGLFIEVVERSLARHQEGLRRALEQPPTSVRAQLVGAARWYLGQPPMSVLRMLRADLAALPPEHAARLSARAFEALFTPLRTLFAEACARGEVRTIHPDVFVGAFLSVLDGAAYVQGAHATGMSSDEMAREVVDLFLEGLYPRRTL